MIIPLKRKHRPYPHSTKDEYWAKKNSPATNHSGVHRQRIKGPEVYDPTKHVLIMRPSGKTVMVHY